MKRLSQDDILDLPIYEQVRGDYRPRVIEHKRQRRASIGDRVSMAFEDRETLRYQIQEMARIEHISSRERIQDELDVYNDLIPGARELSATLFIEIPELDQIRSELERLVGLDEHLCLVLGDDTSPDVIQARFDAKQMEADRLSAVQYVRFELDEAQVKRFGEERVRLRIAHPNYSHECEVSGALLQSLQRDLAGEAPCLLDVRAIAESAEYRDQVLFQNANLRVVRPAAAPDSVVVEVAGTTSLANLDAALLAEVMEVVQRYSREIEQRFGRCHVSTESGAGEGLSWRIAARGQ